MATLTRAVGFPSAHGVLIPEIWSGRLIENLYAKTVFGDIANTWYEGEIKKQGDKVKIRTIPAMQVRTGVIGADLVYDTPESSVVELDIDQHNYVAFEIDDVEKRQADLDYMKDWAADGSEQIKQTTDAAVLGGVYASAHASNKGNSAGVDSQDITLGTSGTPALISKANVIDFIVDMGVVLDEQNAPDDGRYLVFPSAFCGLLKKSDLKDASMMGDAQSALRRGAIGMVDRFTIYQSNNLTITTDGSYRVFNCIFGHKMAITYASQIETVETLTNPKKFGQLMRMKHVYGYKVLKSEALGHFYAAKV